MPSKHIQIAALLFCVITTVSCFPIKSVFLGRPDNKDSYRFDSKNIPAPEAAFRFAEAADKNGREMMVHDQSQNLPTCISLDDLAKSHATRAMLVIHNDTIKYERYYRGCHQLSKEPSYSIAKSFISGLIGIAIDEGHIGGVDDLAVDYIPEIKHLPESKTLTIKHLLNHTSGIKYKITLDAVLYYGKDLLKALKQIEFEEPPGTRLHYLNINSQLLGIILNRSTKKELDYYFTNKIWHPLGMESDAFWSTDKKGEIKTYCCLNATARDYAKYARLYQNNGDWNGEQIIPQDWVTNSIKRDTTKGSGIGYNYSFFIGLKEYDDFSLRGMNENRVYISRKHKVIVVILNDEEKRVDSSRAEWTNKCRQIVDLLK